MYLISQFFLNFGYLSYHLADHPLFNSLHPLVVVYINKEGEREFEEQETTENGEKNTREYSCKYYVVIYYEHKWSKIKQ